MLNIVLPIAGHGRRFQEKGFPLPKPLIPVHGIPMIELVVSNIRPQQPCRFIFVTLQEHVDRFQIDRKLHGIAPDCKVVVVDRVTEGAACTVLLAKAFIDNDAPLMVANSDQWVDVDINDYLYAMDSPCAEGMIMTMWADDPKWSYVRRDAHGRVSEVVEKRVISNDATVGVYNFRRGSDFVWAAEEMIRRNLRVNDEFYVAPVYNHLIARGASICVYNVGREADGMYGLGVPEDLDLFVSHPASEKAVRLARGT